MPFTSDSIPELASSHFDEAALPSGELRPEWRTLMSGLERLGSEELDRRWRQGQRLLEENGVTYNVYGDPRGIDRPWQLDAIPFLMLPGEWRAIEAAISQRATLLSAILSDLYGPQRLLKEGRFPAELVYAHPGFLRPCHGVVPPGGTHLTVYSADLARSPDGQWWVIADRTQAPSGAGYALENRVVLARILPELFNGFHIRRLANYFQTLRESLMALAPHHRDNPRVVLLTPGPYNETYFEHAYLARYLGFTLVEGADLTVRDQHLYLKTLSGLWPVDVVLRRQDDHFCDPLELYGESALGVAGLVQAVRAGNVAIANALGTGLLETAATMAFLPGLCRHLFGEDLLMPSVATWWCGSDRERGYVSDHLESLVIKPAFPHSTKDVVFGADLDARRSKRFRQQLADHPHRYVGQEKVALSKAPTGVGALPEARHVVLRVFAVSNGDNGYAVMPGGLTRFSPAEDSLVVSSQSGGGSKDTWVLSDQSVPFVSLLERVSQPIDVSRGTYAITSRVADNLFWLGRMSERLEAGVRLFRTALRALSDDPRQGAGSDVSDVLDLVERLGRIPPVSEDGGSEKPTIESRLLAGVFDAELAGSLRSDATRLHRLAGLVRDRISLDAWRILVRLDQQLFEPRRLPALRLSRALERLDQGLITLSAFSGIVMESTTRGLGWRFLDVGRRLERGLQMVELLRSGLTEALPEESRRLQKVLEIADCSMTYRSRYQTSVQLPLVVDLLLVDEANPRSVAFQLAQICDHLGTLEKAPSERLANLLERIRGAAVGELVSATPEGVGPTRRRGLELLLSELIEGLLACSASLDHAYLSHAIPGRQPLTFGGAHL